MQLTRREHKVLELIVCRLTRKRELLHHSDGITSKVFRLLRQLAIEAIVHTTSSRLTERRLWITPFTMLPYAVISGLALLPRPKLPNPKRIQSLRDRDGP